MDSLESWIAEALDSHAALMVAGAYMAMASSIRGPFQALSGKEFLRSAAWNQCAMEIEKLTPADAHCALAAHDAEVRFDEHAPRCLYCNQGSPGCDRGRELQGTGEESIGHG